MESRSADPLDYDVVVVGGAVAGASTAILLKRGKPNLRILVVDKTDKFDWKVGESTVEVSAYFLTRVLKQYRHLSQDQLPKQAFRFWFHNDDVTCLQEASETGPTQLARTPSFQLDRSKLDEHLLKVAGEEGSEVWRPAKVTGYTLGEGAGPNTLTIEKSDGTVATVSCRWLVDATGRQAMLARKRGGVTPIDTHPTAAIWVRYRDVPDMDGVAIAGTDPANPWARAVLTARRLATNHFTGWGYWIWFIPLKDGETSVGLVWDKRLVEPRRPHASGEAHAIPRDEPALAPAHSGSRRRSRATAATTRTCPTSSTSSSVRAGRRSATPEDFSTRSTRRGSTRCPSRSGRARGSSSRSSEAPRPTR